MPPDGSASVAATVVRFRSAEKRLDCAMEVSPMVSQFPLSSDFVLLRDAMNQLLTDSFVPSGGGALRLGQRFPSNGPTDAAGCVCHAG